MKRVNTEEKKNNISSFDQHMVLVPQYPIYLSKHSIMKRQKKCQTGGGASVLGSETRDELRSHFLLFFFLTHIKGQRKVYRYNVVNHC